MPIKIKPKILKIVPLYYVSVLLIAALQIPSIFQLKNISNLISILLFEYDGTLPISPIGAIWSIATEMQFYIVAPFLAAGLWEMLGKKGKNIHWAFLAILGLSGFSYRYFMMSHFDWYTSVYAPLLGNFDLFIGGMILALMIQRFKFK